MHFLATLTDKGLKFGSDYHRALFLDFSTKNQGRVVRIKLAKGGVSDNRRGWMFGAIIPFLKELVPPWRELTDDEVYSVVKTEFGGFYAEGIDGKVKKFAGSLSSKEADSERFDNAVLLLAEWVRNNYGQELPDPEEYKRKLDNPVLESYRQLSPDNKI